MENTISAGRNRVKLGERIRQLLTALGGTVAAFGLAVLLHYIYDWSGGIRFAAIFAAVNESVWEHVKILLFPYLLWSFAEYYLLKAEVKKLVVARTVGAYAVGLLTVCVFYIYTGVLGYSVVWFDIASAALWLLAGEIISMRILNSRLRAGEYYIVALSALVLLVVMLLCFTVSPPRIGLFADPNTGLYGMEIMP